MPSPHLAFFAFGYSFASTEVDMKRRTDSERRALVEEWRGSGVAAVEFCNRHGISRESLKRWKNRPGVGSGEIFMPVKVVESFDVPASNSCVIRVGEQVLIECREHTNERSLVKAIRAAVAACGPISVR